MEDRTVRINEKGVAYVVAQINIHKSVLFTLETKNGTWFDIAISKPKNLTNDALKTKPGDVVISILKHRDNNGAYIFSTGKDYPRINKEYFANKLGVIEEYIGEFSDVAGFLNAIRYFVDFERIKTVTPSIDEESIVDEVFNDIKN